MPKHGSAPFTIADDWSINDATGRSIAKVPMMQEDSPNTKLLVASPKLLESLKNLLNYATLVMIANGTKSEYFAGCATDKNKRGTVAQALNAIEAATGYRPEFVPGDEDGPRNATWKFRDD